MTTVHAPAITAIARFMSSGSTSKTRNIPNGSPATALNVIALTTRLSTSPIVDGTKAKLARMSIAATFTNTLMGA